MQHAELAIIGGTGLSRFFTDSSGGVKTTTPFGETSGPITVAAVEGVPVAFLPRHGDPHTVPPHRINYRANLWALRQLGVQRVIAVNAVGGIREDIATGALVIPDQLVDYTWGREHTYSDGSPQSSLEHVDFSYPFDATLREHLLAAARSDSANVVFDAGVYAATQGPRLETAAEINRLEKDGCDIVGMTAMPEAGLARELDMAYASLCLVVNPAAGRSTGLITMEDIERVIQYGMERIRAVLRASVSTLAAG